MCRARGIKERAFAPPLWRMAWRLGWALPPPHFMTTRQYFVISWLTVGPVAILSYWIVPWSMTWPLIVTIASTLAVFDTLRMAADRYGLGFPPWRQITDSVF